METYHKIQTIFKRDPKTKFKTLLEGEFSLPEFDFLSSNDWVLTEKVDGTNIRVIFANDGIEFRGKSDQAQLPAQLVKNLEKRFLPQLKTFENSFSDGICLYGEGYGPKIQKGGKYRDDQDFVLFDIKIGEYWLQREDVEQIAIKLGLDVVPILFTGTIADMVDIVRKGFNSKWGNFIAEGIVARPKTELKTRSGHRIITKLKHKDFALITEDKWSILQSVDEGEWVTRSHPTMSKENKTNEKKYSYLKGN